MEGALGLPGRESKWNWALRKQDGSSLSNRDTIQTQALASFSAPGHSVWGPGVLTFCRLQVGDDGKTVMVVITAPGHRLLYVLHRSPNLTRTRKVRSPSSSDPRPPANPWPHNRWPTGQCGAGLEETQDQPGFKSGFYHLLDVTPQQRLCFSEPPFPLLKHGTQRGPGASSQWNRPHFLTLAAPPLAYQKAVSLF